MNEERQRVIDDMNRQWDLPLAPRQNVEGFGETGDEPGSVAPSGVTVRQPAPVTIPDVLRVHMLTRYWYCEEETRGRVMEGWKAERPYTTALTGGTDIHDWLETRPKTDEEQRLAERIDEWKKANEFSWYGKPTQELHRPIWYYNQNVKVIAHPDNLRVIQDQRKPYVQVEEYKTVDRLAKLPDGTFGYPFFKRSQAEFQAQLYRWVLGHVLPQVEATPYNDLILTIYKRPGSYFLKEYSFAYMGDAAIEAQIRNIFDGWSGRRDPIIPARWKCDRCDPGFKSRCRIAASNWTFGLTKP